MAFSEIFLILIIGVFVLKPEDLKSLGALVGRTTKYLTRLKQELFSSIHEDQDISAEEQIQINNYMQKIFALSNKYEGEYNLSAVKAYYHKLILEQHMSNSSTTSTDEGSTKIQ